MPRTTGVSGGGPVNRGRPAKPARPSGGLRDRIGRKGSRQATAGDTGVGTDETVKESR